VKTLAALLLAGLVLSCAETPGTMVEGTSGPSVEWQDEGPNVLALGRGATIVDRSGEISFEYSSMFTIDGQPTSMWSSPPGNIEQWLVAELPVRTRIDALGLVSATFAIGSSVEDVRFELSLDGTGWTDLGIFSFDRIDGKQLKPIDPAEAKFIRFTTLTNHGNAVVTHIPTLLAHGEELEPWRRPSIEGRWMLNDVEGHFREDGRRVYGRVDLDPPMWIDGAWGERIVRFAWVRGRSYGVGLIAVSPGGEGLNGIWWYENVVDFGNELGQPWFGRRIGDPDQFQVPTSGVAQLHIERDGRFPLFGLIVDERGEFDPEASRPAVDFLRLALDTFPQYRVRLEVSEFGSEQAAPNLEKSRRIADRLRAGLEAQGLPGGRLFVTPIGSERPYPWRNAPLQRLMYSRVDFSLSASE
jgi:hypothetical protein